eukprot:TRINITY_DN3580_c2_g1_i4.p3 TRINITY_DN3580_c2_g1~~TRINITY_DN3580_c2_g1_i4.p3  ORF type:complete len:284 (+),score=-8.53 TRINITY_DN3580_c2_g1_i4:1010-1861(+)
MFGKEKHKQTSELKQKDKAETHQKRKLLTIELTTADKRYNIGKQVRRNDGKQRYKIAFHQGAQQPSQSIRTTVIINRLLLSLFDTKQGRPFIWQLLIKRKIKRIIIVKKKEEVTLEEHKKDANISTNIIHSGNTQRKKVCTGKKTMLKTQQLNQTKMRTIKVTLIQKTLQKLYQLARDIDRTLAQAPTNQLIAHQKLYRYRNCNHIMTKIFKKVLTHIFKNRKRMILLANHLELNNRNCSFRFQYQALLSQNKLKHNCISLKIIEQTVIDIRYQRCTKCVFFR